MPEPHSDTESEDDSFDDSNSFASSSSDDDSEEVQVAKQTASKPNIAAGARQRLTQKEQLLRAERERNEQNQVEWLHRAQKPRTAVIQELEGKRLSGVLHKTPNFEPEWVQIAKEQQIARDLRGIERFLNRSAPQLPPEPSWIEEAKLKRRDVPLLLKPNEKVHESNKEAPIWGDAAQKILRGFLKEDSSTLPEWMSKGVGMSVDEKQELLAQLAKLRALLEEERALTNAKQNALEKAKLDYSQANLKLNDGVKAFRELRDHRKLSDGISVFVENAENAFGASGEFFHSLKSEYGLEEKVKNRVDRHIAKDSARQEARAKLLAEKKAQRAAERKAAKRKEKKEKKTGSVGPEAKPSENNNPAADESDPSKKKKSGSSAGSSKKKKKSRTVDSAPN